MVDINQIVTEEQVKIQEEVNARVLSRLQAALQAAQDKLTAVQADVTSLEEEIKSRTPEVETPAEDAGEAGEEQPQG